MHDKPAAVAFPAVLLLDFALVMQLE